VALAVSACFMVNALVGEKGLLGTLKARSDDNAARAALNDLRYENARLQELARRLREDPSAIEEVARRDLGLVRPGETLVILKDATPANARDRQP
jgi:cell division protein FtsB